MPLPDLPIVAPAVRKRGGGPDSHKPGCKCRACVARRRKAEAFDGGAGELALIPEVDSTKVIRPDLPDIYTQKRTYRTHIAQWAMMRAQEPGITTKDVAIRLGLNPDTLRSIVSLAAKEGWLKFDDPMSQLEHEIIPQVSENLKYFLKKRDKQVTLETAKGTLFPQFKESKGISEAPQTVLAIKIEMPADKGRVSTINGIIAGTPRVIDITPVTEDD